MNMYKRQMLEYEHLLIQTRKYTDLNMIETHTLLKQQSAVRVRACMCACMRVCACVRACVCVSCHGRFAGLDWKWRASYE